jgi:hypothetical protein
MSRNLNDNVTLLQKREYFNAEFFNLSEDTVPATYSTTLLKPMIHNPEKYIMCINRFRLPLSGIPLTRNGIPFQQWQVGLGYQNAGAGTVFKPVYVPQTVIGRATAYNSYCIGQTPDLQTINTQLDPFVIQSDVSLGSTAKLFSLFYPFYPAYDNYVSQVPTIYMLSLNGLSIEVYQAGSSAVVATLTPSNVVGYIYAITAVTTTSNGDVYVAYTVNDYVNNPARYTPFVQVFTRAGATTYTASAIYIPSQMGGVTTFLTSFPLQNTFITTLSITNSAIIAYAQTTTGTATNATICAWPLDSILLAAFPTVVTTTNNFSISHPTNFTYMTSSLSGVMQVYNNSGILLNTFNNIFGNAFIGFDVNNNVLVKNNDEYYALNYTTGVIEYYFTPQNGAYLIANSTSFSVNVDGGAQPIFTYQTFLNQINSAFESAFLLIKSTYTANNGPTNPPSVIYDSATKLFSLLCEGQYAELDSDSDPKFQIFMNQPLWNKFFFPSYDTQPQPNFKQLIVQNNGINAVVGTGSATLPQFLYMQQEQSSIYSFYDLTRIIITTNQIGVAGDAEAVVTNQNGTASNNALSIITDIVPDTTTLAPGSDIIYVPNGILRWYNLYTTTPLTKIDLQFYYETKDSSIYPVNIIAGEWFSAKLEFKKVQN